MCEREREGDNWTLKPMTAVAAVAVLMCLSKTIFAALSFAEVCSSLCPCDDKDARIESFCMSRLANASRLVDW